MPSLLGNTVYQIERCPQCGVANPLLITVNKPKLHYKDAWANRWWHFTSECSKCSRHVLFYGHSTDRNTLQNGDAQGVEIKESFPSAKRAADQLPDRARAFLQQALDSLHAPDGAMMLAASAVDSMLKDKGYKRGSLYERINKARVDGLFTEQMESWAHEIRLNANEPRHADEDFTGASAADATQVIEFAEALGEYLFVLPGRVQKWAASTVNGTA